MSATSYIEQVYENKGINAAYDEACNTVRAYVQQNNELFASPFFELRVHHETGKKKLWPCTMGYISRAYDMRDCDPEIPEFFYCDEDDGKLYPVTVGKQHRITPIYGDELPFCYAASDMVANGKVVGCVTYTDH